MEYSTKPAKHMDRREMMFGNSGKEMIEVPHDRYQWLLEEVDRLEAALHDCAEESDRRNVRGLVQRVMKDRAPRP